MNMKKIRSLLFCIDAAISTNSLKGIGNSLPAVGCNRNVSIVPLGNYLNYTVRETGVCKPLPLNGRRC